MKYKSLLLDVDGTLVPVGPHTLPSQKVLEALQRAQSHVTVSLVSGRPILWLEDIFKSLNLFHPCIINGGSQIIDPQNQKILWEKPLSKESVEKILRIVRDHRIPFLVNDNGAENKNPIMKEFEKPLAMQLSYFDSKGRSDECLRTLQEIEDISAHKFFSWDKDRNYKMEIYITHKDATKQQATEELAKLLNVGTHEIIGVGDARNDIPLLSVCGLRVAMGNADDKLKAVAHHIAPSIEDDGVAHVVEKFILNEIG